MARKTEQDQSSEVLEEGHIYFVYRPKVHGADEASETVDGGATTSLTVELEDGTYEIWCPVGDHRGRGMEGTLTVE